MVAEDLEKKDNVNWEDGGKAEERRWNIHLAISLNNRRDNLLFQDQYNRDLDVDRPNGTF